MKELDKLPLNVVIELYQHRLSCEKNGDNKALIELENQYPALFAIEFEEFIHDLRMTIEYINHKIGENFSEILSHKEMFYH